MADSDDQPIYVNDGPLAPGDYAFLQPTDPDLPPDELRRRLHADGYLFLKGLLPREDVLRARAAYFEHLAPSGVLKPGTEPVDGIFDDARDVAAFPGIGVGRLDSLDGDPADADADATSARTFLARALDAHVQPWYARDLCGHPRLRAFVAALTGWGADATRPLERTLLRNNIPRTAAIGVHYDQIFLRQGAPTSVTAWVPLGDVGLRGGGLVYLEGGHALGEALEAAFTQKAAAAGLSPEETRSAFNRNMLASGVLSEAPAAFARAHGRRWLLSAYEAGDVVLHTPYMIHASTVNHDAHNVIRLATDLRFVDATQPWDTRWAHQFRLGDGV